MVLAPKIYTLRGAFFNKLGYSRKFSGSRSNVVG
jgi:hypothetical protein